MAFLLDASALQGAAIGGLEGEAARSVDAVALLATFCALAVVLALVSWFSVRSKADISQPKDLWQRPKLSTQTRHSEHSDLERASSPTGPGEGVAAAMSVCPGKSGSAKRARRQRQRERKALAAHAVDFAAAAADEPFLKEDTGDDAEQFATEDAEDCCEVLDVSEDVSTEVDELEMNEHAQASVDIAVSPMSSVPSQTGGCQEDADPSAAVVAKTGEVDATEVAELPEDESCAVSEACDEAPRAYSLGLLLAHRELSIRIARGPPGLPPPPPAHPLNEAEETLEPPPGLGAAPGCARLCAAIWRDPAGPPTTRSTAELFESPRPAKHSVPAPRGRHGAPRWAE